MKNGKSLQELATELDRQRAAKRDFMVDTRNLSLAVGRPAVPATKTTPAVPAVLVSSIGNDKGVMGQFGLRTHALRQLEEHLGIPAGFADRLQGKHADLLVHTVNELFQREPTTRLVRTLDTDMRAFLSNSYRCMDNFEFAQAILEVAAKFPCNVHSCEVTESRLYIKIVRDDMVERIGFKEGWEMGQGHNFFDEVKPAAVFSNSEIGSGSLQFSPGVWTRNCTNLAVWEQQTFKKIHLGTKGSAGEAGFWEIFADRTKELSDTALWAQVRDITAASLEGQLFRSQVEQLQGATQDRIEGDVVKTIELTAKTFQLSEGEKKGVLEHLIRGGQLTRYGLHSAITRFSQSEELTYDRASELERLGGRVIELPAGDWRRLAEAA